jgi:hypothetical protein
LIEAHLVLLVASPDVQEAWASAERVPAEEIALQYYDAVPLCLTGLRERGSIDSADEEALHRLNDYLRRVQPKLFLDGPHVTRAPEWERVRQLAVAALDTVRRPVSDKRA